MQKRQSCKITGGGPEVAVVAKFLIATIQVNFGADS